MSEHNLEDLSSAIEVIKGLEDGSIDESQYEDILNGNQESQADDLDEELSEVDGEEEVEVEDEETIEVVDEEEDAEADPEPETSVEETPEVQTPEENAYFAELRRQKQAEAEQARLDQIAQERLQASPEYEMAKLLAEQSGLTPAEMVEQLREAQLHKQAESQGVPVEFLKEQQATLDRTKQLEEKLNQIEFDRWHSEKLNESAQLKEKYKGSLTDEDIDAAMVFMLNDLKAVDMPLERAVYALHGSKIETHLRNVAKQEALAEVSGRKQSPLASQGGKSASPSSLTSEERFVAKAMGISEKDYLKYKN